MTKFASDVKTIPHADRDVFRILSDLRNLELVKESIPKDKVSDFTFDEDRVSFHVDTIGRVTLLVTEREPNKLLKFRSESLPFDVFLEIHLVSRTEKDTELSMIVQSDLNPFMKGLIEKPMREVLDKVSEALTQLPYDRV